MPDGAGSIRSRPDHDVQDTTKGHIMDDLMTIDEVCREFGFTRQRLAKMRWLGGESTPPFIKLSRTDIRYSRADVIGWFESRKLTSTAA